MDARSQILADIRSAISKSQDGPAPEPPREYRVEAENAPGSQPVIDEMVEALEDYTAQVVVVDESDAPDAIAKFLSEAGASSVVIPHALPDQWREAAGRDGRKVHTDNQGKELSHQQLNTVDAVLTGSRLGISLSGTIVLDGEGDQGRRAITLIPDTHVCVLRAKDVYPTVPQAVALLGEHPERPLTWFAGPSATSDIELVRVDGVHGPRNLRVVIIK